MLRTGWCNSNYHLDSTCNYYRYCRSNEPAAASAGPDVCGPNIFADTGDIAFYAPAPTASDAVIGSFANYPSGCCIGSNAAAAPDAAGPDSSFEDSDLHPDQRASVSNPGFAYCRSAVCRRVARAAVSDLDHVYCRPADGHHAGPATSADHGCPDFGVAAIRPAFGSRSAALPSGGVGRPAGLLFDADDPVEPDAVAVARRRFAAEPVPVAAAPSYPDLAAAAAASVLVLAAEQGSALAASFSAPEAGLGAPACDPLSALDVADHRRPDHGRGLVHGHPQLIRPG